MRVRVGDRYTLDGSCQYGYTRDCIKIVINPYDTVIKIKDTFSDRLRLRSMYRLGDTGWEISIDNSIINRYFVREDE